MPNAGSLSKSFACPNDTELRTCIYIPFGTTCTYIPTTYVYSMVILHAA